MSGVCLINLKVAWSCGLGLNFLKVCHKCRSKASLWVAHLNIPRWLADGFEGVGLNFGPAPIQWGEIIHKFVRRATAARKTLYHSVCVCRVPVLPNA